MSQITEQSTVMLKPELRDTDNIDALTARVMFVVDPDSDESVVGLSRPLCGRTDWRLTDLEVVPGAAYVEHFEEQIESSLVLAREWAERADLACMVLNIFEGDVFERYEKEMWELVDRAAARDGLEKGEELLLKLNISPREHRSYHKAAHGAAQREAARILLQFDYLLKKAKDDYDREQGYFLTCMECGDEFDDRKADFDEEMVRCPHCDEWSEASYA